MNNAKMKTHYTVFPRDAGWRVIGVRNGAVHQHELECSPDATLDDRAVAVRRAMEAAGDGNTAVTVALPSSWCLCARISTEDLGRGKRLQAMGFRLEEQLPISAEDVIADYVETSDGEALGVCCEAARAGELGDALTRAGIVIERVSPAALLATAHVLARHRDADAVLLRSRPPGNAPADLDLVEIDGGRPVRWWWFADDEDALRERLAARQADRQSAAKVLAVGCDPSRPDTGGDPDMIEPAALDANNLDDAAAGRAARLHEEGMPAWIDLRPEGLAPTQRLSASRRRVGALAAAVILLLGSLLIVTQWRGRRYRALSREHERRQVDLYRKAFPGRRLPVSVKGRLISEYRKLRGQASGDEGGGLRFSALGRLGDVLSVLPTDLRYRVLDLTIDPDRVRMEGQTLSHADAERLAAGIRGLDGYDVEPPRTQALADGGVSFVFAADDPDGGEGRP